jgi:hypothetical protein
MSDADVLLPENGKEEAFGIVLKEPGKEMVYITYEMQDSSTMVKVVHISSRFWAFPRLLTSQ